MLKTLVIVVAVAGLATGCGSSSKNSDDSATTTTTGAVIDTASGSTSGGGGTFPPASSPPATSGQTAPPATNASGPVVTSISGPPPVNVCSNAPNVTSPTETTLKWTTTGATSVNVAIDTESGTFQTGLAPSGELAVPLPCAGNSNTYFVIALGPGGTRAVKSLTTQGQ